MTEQRVTGFETGNDKTLNEVVSILNQVNVDINREARMLLGIYNSKKHDTDVIPVNIAEYKKLLQTVSDSSSRIAMIAALFQTLLDKDIERQKNEMMEAGRKEPVVAATAPKIVSSSEMDTPAQKMAAAAESRKIADEEVTKAFNQDPTTWIFTGKVSEITGKSGILYHALSNKHHSLGKGKLEVHPEYLPRFKPYLIDQLGGIPRFAPSDIESWSDGFYGYDKNSEQQSELYLKHVDDSGTVMSFIWSFDNAPDEDTLFISTNDDKWINVNILSKTIAGNMGLVIQQLILNLYKKF